MSYQQITLVGNLGNDPELRYTPNGTAVTNLSVAVNNTYTNQQGEAVKETAWFRVSVFGKQAEACSQYLAKGRQVLVVGRMQFDPKTGGPKIWESRNNGVGASFEVTAITVRFLGGSKGNDNGSNSEYADAPTEEEIPF